MRLKLFAVSAVLIGGIGFAAAQGDVIAQRKDIMKGVGQATAPIGPMLRGEQPFDLARVQATLDTYIRAAKASPALYTAASATGDTRALPAAFAEKDKFNGLFANWDAVATAAKTAITSEATFKTEMPKVLAACGACHQPYRKPQ
jgi:cytochrome c556